MIDRISDILSYHPCTVHETFPNPHYSMLIIYPLFPYYSSLFTQGQTNASEIVGPTVAGI